MRRIYLSIAIFFIFCLVEANARDNGDIVTNPVGNLEIISILDANTSMESSLLPELKNYPELLDLFKSGPLPAVSKTYFVRNGDHNILIDSGWGQEQSIKGMTLEQLKKINVKPSDITDILLTHLDFDHIGGLTRDGKAVFPNATLWIAVPEYEAWINGNVAKRPANAIERARALNKAYAGKIRQFKHGDEIFPGIRALDASGHTPGHTAYQIGQEKDNMLVVGDLIHVPQVQLVKPQLSTIYDMDMEKAAKSRQMFLDKAVKDGDRFGGMHFPQVGKVYGKPDGSYVIE